MLPFRDWYVGKIDAAGAVAAAGVGAAIVGFRAHGALIDDPIRSREGADSQHVRGKIWDWSKSELLTRLAPRRWGTSIPCGVRAPRREAESSHDLGRCLQSCTCSPRFGRAPAP